MSTTPMLAHATWFVVASGTSVATWTAVTTARGAVPLGRGGAAPRRTAVTAGGAAVILLVLALLYDVRAIASADAHVVARLFADRGSTTDGVMSVVTTMGDVAPTFVLAGALAAVTYQHTRHWVAWLLPASIMVEVIVQSTILRVVDSYTFTELMPGLTIGGSDGIPSGGVARLFCVLVLASMLWQPHNPTTSWVLRDIAIAAVFVEAMSRFYLGRHLLADVAGGLLLGVAVTAAFGWLGSWSHGRAAAARAVENVR